uniref:Serine/threonine protein phosphatase 2A regulatory subunit n=1 Tax=Hirondellea gigas TaxID=1518452 RepID=A0A6A7G7N0_9CRUS
MKGMLKTFKRRFSQREIPSGNDRASPRAAAGDPDQHSQASHESEPTTGENRSRQRPSSQTRRDVKDSSRSTATPTGANPTPVSYSQCHFTKKDLLTAMPSFRECIAAEKELLFIRKLKLCCIYFDFDDQSPQENVCKEMKRQILLEAVDYISTTKKWFSEAIVPVLLEMISVNLFRALPPSAHAPISEADDEDPVVDPAWPHLQIIYEFLLRFIVSSDTDMKVMKKYINGHFILNILELFQSADSRERDYLKTILHRIYGKFMSQRNFIRQSITNVFLKVIYECDRHKGIGELLEILGSVINGFAQPVKIEHKKFLRTVLLPLHTVKFVAPFHAQLAFCISQFIDKDPSLSPLIIRGLLAYWPLTNSAKEVLFLNELEEVLEATQPDEFKQIVHPLFKRLAACIGSPHFQVAERALFFWNNEYLASMTSDHAAIVLPLLYPALHRNSKTHWNSTVHSLTFNIIKMFMELNDELFQECRQAYEAKELSEESESEKHSANWETIVNMANVAIEVREGATRSDQKYDDDDDESLMSDGSS